MKQSPRVVFFGNERLVSGLKSTTAPLLTGLIDHGYDVCAVVVNHHDGMSRNSRELEVARIAREHNIPVLAPKRLLDIEGDLRDLHADAAVLAAYGRIIPQRIIDIFSPIGIINIHPSLLPRHRGSTPIETAILAGDTVTGVSIMQLSAGMDEGPVYAQVSLPLTMHETKFELYEQLAQRSAELLLSILPSILDGSLQPTPQSTTGVTYTAMLSKQDGIVDPSADTAETIERTVRAHLGFPKSKLIYRDRDIILTACRVVDAPIDGQLCIPCAKNSTLLVESLVAPNGKSMTGESYLRGLR